MAYYYIILHFLPRVRQFCYSETLFLQGCYIFYAGRAGQPLTDLMPWHTQCQASITWQWRTV